MNVGRVAIFFSIFFLFFFFFWAPFQWASTCSGFTESALCILSTLLVLVLLCQPGESKHVTLVSIGGNRVIRGGNGIVDDPVDDGKQKAVLEALEARKIRNEEEPKTRSSFLPEKCLLAYLLLFC